MRGRVAVGIGVLVGAVAAGLATAGTSAVIPAEVVSAEKVVGRWLDQVEGESLAQVERELGPPKARRTWQFQGGPQPLYVYETPGGAELSVFFYGDRAVKVSFQLLSS